MPDEFARYPTPRCGDPAYHAAHSYIGFLGGRTWCEGVPADPAALNEIMTGPGPLMDAPRTSDHYVPPEFGGPELGDQSPAEAPAADSEAPDLAEQMRRIAAENYRQYESAKQEAFQERSRAQRMRAALAGIAGLIDGKGLTDHELIDKARDARWPATPPGRSADEIRAALVTACAETLGSTDDGCRPLARALMDRVVGPLIAERDREYASHGKTIDALAEILLSLREEHDRAERLATERTRAITALTSVGRGAVETSGDLEDGINADALTAHAEAEAIRHDLDEQRQRAERAEAIALVWRDRFDNWFNRAQRYRLAWRSARRRAARGRTEGRDALREWQRIYLDAGSAMDDVLGTEVANGAGQGLVSDVRLVVERCKRAEAERDRLREVETQAGWDVAALHQAERERDFIRAERDSLKSNFEKLYAADARARALAKGWIARGESAAMPSPFVARGREVLAALDGTDGGDR